MEEESLVLRNKWECFVGRRERYHWGAVLGMSVCGASKNEAENFSVAVSPSYVTRFWAGWQLKLSMRGKMDGNKASLLPPPLFVRGSGAHTGQKKRPSHFVITNFTNSQAHRPYKYLLNLPHSIQGHCLLLRPPAPEELCSNYHLPPFLEVGQGITKKELGEEGHGRWVGGSAIWRIDSCIAGTLWGTGFSAPPGHTRFLKRFWTWVMKHLVDAISF